MRTLDLLRNHPWNMQAVITDRTGYVMPGVPALEVRVGAINGPSHGTEKTTFHSTKKEAYTHAYTVLGWQDDIAASSACND
jgi:hypothetical protein